ncbi:MAG TPA: hypothetical protein ENK16_09125, partial [Chromatiales bacterium]|nr:hypothetical protein [Chromatiales bacterium]
MTLPEYTNTTSSSRRTARWLAVAVIALLIGVPAPLLATSDAPPVLQTTPRQRDVAHLVTRFAERAHYSRIRVDDALSARILDNYLKALDPGKQYFLESDIVYFSRYRNQLDDALRAGQLSPVFDIFRLYRLRAQQNIEYALTLLETQPDF